MCFLALTFEPWSFVVVVKLIYVLENGTDIHFNKPVIKKIMRK